MTGDADLALGEYDSYRTVTGDKLRRVSYAFFAVNILLRNGEESG